jgi:tetratricopeptide (TPR) repeat protein
MARYLSLVIGLCVLSLVAVVLLSASPEEKLERSLSRLPSNEALSMLNEVFLDGNRTPNLLMRRAELLSASGAFDEAQDTLETLAESRDGALLARESLARLARDLGHVAAAASQLQKAYALDSTPERLERLARLLDLGRQTDAELALLQGAQPNDLTDRSAARLLELLVARGDMEGAERLLRARAELATPARLAMRGTLAELLIGADRANEATAVAAEWFGRDKDASALAVTVERLIDRGFVDRARVLAEVALSSGLPGAHAVIPRFAIGGHNMVARALLRDWLDENQKLDAEGQMNLLDYSRTMNDFSEAQAFMRRNRPERLEPAFVIGVLKGSYFRFGPASLAESRRYLLPYVLDADPLFAAEIMLASQRPSEAVKYLSYVAQRDLEPWEEDAWGRLAARVNPIAARTRLLQTRPDHTSLAR